MIELGEKSHIIGVELLRPIKNIVGRPQAMPLIENSGDKVICGYDQGLGERIIVCESLEDMWELYDSYAQGCALQIHWYLGDDPEFVRVIGGNADNENAEV